MRLKKFILIISLILLGVGLIGSIFFTYFAGSYTIRPQALTSEDGTPLASLVYTPKDISGTVPGIVVCHGFVSNKQSMQGISLELVKCGFVVIAIDFRGHGESGGNLGEERNLYGDERNKLVDDVYAAVQYLKSLPYVDNNSIGLVGHSMGGASVMGTAIKYQAEINATVSIGMVGISGSQYSINGTAISNLLIAMGGLEELFTEAQALEFLSDATGGLVDPVEADTLYGDFIYGNATKLFIAPFADHILEISDVQIMAEACAWFRSSFYTGSTPPITDFYRQIFIILSVAGAGLAFFPVTAYLKPIIQRHQPENPRKINDPGCKKKILLYISGYWLVTIIAFLLLLPLSTIFAQNLNFIMSNYLIGLFMGYAIGLLLIFYVVHKWVDKDPRPFLRRIKEQISNHFNQSMFFGIVIFLYSFGTLVGLLHWSFFDLLPTTREFGATLMLAMILFPYAFLDQLYIRNMQSYIARGRLKEQLKVVLLASIAKTAIFIPVLFIDLGLASLVVMILLIGLPFLEFLTTWIYMYSGRNLIAPAIYLTLVLSWVLVAFMPFGNYAYSLL